jgi:hypothetical protein
MSIRVKYQNSWYGYQGHDGYALYINGQKMHTGLFNSVSALRKFWSLYRLMLCAGVIPYDYR